VSLLGTLTLIVSIKSTAGSVVMQGFQSETCKFTSQSIVTLYAIVS
jgi:hypothetical protein